MHLFQTLEARSALKLRPGAASDNHGIFFVSKWSCLFFHCLSKCFERRDDGIRIGDNEQESLRRDHDWREREQKRKWLRFRERISCVSFVV